MTNLLSEEEADRQVIRSLLNEIRRLNKLMKGRIMGKLLMDEHGDLFMAHSYEPATTEKIEEEIKHAREEADTFDEMKKLSDKLRNENPAPANETPSVPSPEAPAAPVAPAGPADAQPTPFSAPQNADPAVPAAPAIQQ